MKKIEEAAQAWANSKAAGNNFAAAHGDFIAGARYALDAMTSDAAMEAFIAAASTKYGYEGEILGPVGVIKYCIAAVRKEIEGE